MHCMFYSGKSMGKTSMTSGFLWSSHGNLVLFGKMMSFGLLRVLSVVVAKRFTDEWFQIMSIRVAFQCILDSDYILLASGTFDLI